MADFRLSHHTSSQIPFPIRNDLHHDAFCTSLSFRSNALYRVGILLCSAHPHMQTIEVTAKKYNVSESFSSFYFQRALS